ncbi:Ring finger protein [Melia azedarach]|uniref:Ring finger protein n=1 Tax=Melia azedarach TaxID=155640 RepID=A0ACC1XGQ2_MELAZ|nr:Ring finger protein [Melia azedarach]
MSSLAIISDFSLFALLSLLMMIPIYIFRNQISKLQSFIQSYIIPIITRLNCGWRFVIQQAFFGHRLHVGGLTAEIGEERLSIVHYKYKPGRNEEAVECAVCLCKIEEGDEVGKLRCDHLFHKNCLDRWVRYRRMLATCPICRDFIAPYKAIVQYGVEVLVLDKFTAFTSTERDTWWLR